MDPKELEKFMRRAKNPLIQLWRLVVLGFKFFFLTNKSTKTL